MNKAGLRKKMKRMLTAQTRIERAEKSEKIIDRLVGLSEYSNAKTILVYVSMDEEVGTREFIPRAILDGKRVVVPAVSPDERTMTLHEIKKIGELGPGYRGICEPKNRGVCIGYEEIDLAIAPGLAFDSKGNRLGRGKGMFDKLFTKLKCQKVALAFDFQVVEEVPVDEHDKTVDAVITEKRVITRDSIGG